MQNSRIITWILLVIVASGHCAFTTLSQREGEVVVQCRLESPGKSGSELSMRELSQQFATAITHRSGTVFPAELLQVIADPSVSMIVSIQGTNPVRVVDDREKSDDNEYPQLVTGQRGAIVQKLYSRVPVQAVRVTPVFKKSGVLYAYTNLTVTMRYTPLRGAPLRSNSHLSRIKSIVRNPNELVQPAVPRFAPQRQESRIALNGKCMNFTITNGVSNTDDRETDVEHTCNGLYQIKPSEITYLGKSLPITQIALYASDRTLQEEVPAEDSIPAGVVPIALHVEDKNSDGLFNGDDRLLFYGSSMHYWYWNADSSRWDFSFNSYDHKRTYWITLGQGKRMPQKEKANGGVPTAQGWKLRRMAIPKSIKYSNSAYNGNSSKEWKWFGLNSQVNQCSVDLETYDVVPGTPVEARLSYIAQWRVPHVYLTLDGGEEKAPLKNRASQWVAGSSNAQHVRCRAGGTVDGWYIDVSSFDLRYWRNLSMKGLAAPFHFYSDSSVGLKQYHVQELPDEKVWCLRLDEFHNEAVLIGLQEGGSCIFSDSSGSGYEYLFTPESAIKSVIPQPVSVQSRGRVSTNLYSVTGEYSYVIIASPELLPYADSLTGIKEREGFRTVLFSTADLYRQFSGGAATPVALRNALIQLRKQCPNLEYLLLFGSGHYDYKNLITTEPNHLFPFLDNDMAKEDYYGLLDKGENLGTNNDKDLQGADLLIGRIPAVTPEDALSYIAKYEEVTQAKGAETSWRNRFVMTNDDGTQLEKKDPLNHSLSSDLLFKKLTFNRSDMDIVSINLLEYQFVGSAKPDAHKELIREINRGCAFANYFGHGSYHTVSDERLFLLGDIDMLQNKGKYPIFSFYSCAVGFFDMPDVEDIGSELVLARDKGAIATWVSSRSSNNGPNVKASQRKYAALFDDPLFVKTIGEGTFAAKEASVNRRYVLFGDPSYRPYVQRVPLSLKIGKRPGSMPVDTCKVFDTLWVTTSIPAGFEEGGVSLLLQNPTRYGEKTKDGDKLGNLKGREYSLPGQVVFTYEDVLPPGNTFQYPFRIPRSIKQGSDSICVKLSFQKDGKIASGIINTIGVHGINLDNIDPTDRVGPLVKCRIKYKDEDTLTTFAEEGPTLVIDGFTVKKETIVDGDNDITTTYASLILEIGLDDKTGIDHYSRKTGEGISVAIDGVLPFTQLNDLYQPLRGDSCGRVPLVLKRSQFPGKGKYAMRVQATDQLGNRTVEKYTLDVRSMGEEEYHMGEVFAYPCPVSRRGSSRFWFNQYNRQVTNAVLKIYTLDGRLIRSVKDVTSGFEWDLRDQKGNLLSPNVYLYRLFVEVDAQKSGFGDNKKKIQKSPIRKITILP